LLSSINDPKQYRLVSLKNKLSVLLVSDPSSELASAALAVSVGHFDDPQDSQGLAHLLEHMLFLGTKKYPDSSEYQAYIRTHGGQNNAWTSSEYTNFFFCIENNCFKDALVRFSDFFISPTLDGQAISKEISAVDSEFQLKFTDENRRVLAVIKETVNQAHPFSKFSVGNKQTLLNEDHHLEQLLTEFYVSHYCAGKMKLVLCSHHSLEQLEAIANQFFSPVENRQLATQYPDVEITLTAQKNIEIKIEPDKDIRKLTLNFAMPVEDDWYKSKPLSYIAYLLGHEGEGSLLSHLKSQGLANSLSAGSGMSGYNYKEFSIILNLTQQGMTDKDLIIALVFDYIKLIKNQGIDCWRYSEKHSIFNAAFEFQDPVQPLELTSHLVINMFKYQDQDILFGDYAMTSFEPRLITQCLELMTPKNLRLIIVARDQTTNQVARWYNTPYQVSAISEQEHQNWLTLCPEHQMTLPVANPFIVERLAYHCPTQLTPLPEILIQKQGIRLWHYTEQEFKVPRGHIYTAIDSDVAGTDARAVALCQLYVEILHDDLAEMTYPAEIAGLNYDIYAHQAGVTLHVTGYTPKLFLFFEMLITQIRQRKFCQQRFNEIKQQLTISWQNSEMAKPINRLFRGLGVVLQPKQYPNDQLLHELQSITLAELQQFISKLYKSVHLECYVHGDWERSEVEQFGHSIHQQIAAIATPINEVKRELININNRGTLTREFASHGSDSAVIVYIQSAMADLRKVALFSLLNHFVSPEFFSQIRTQQQLGYLCGSSYMPINRHPGILFYIQSNVAAPYQLIEAIDQVLADFSEIVEQLSPSEWQRGTQGLLSQITVQDTSSIARAHRHWLSIGNRDYQFDHRQRIAKQLTKITKTDLLDFVKTKINAPNQDRLILCSYGENLDDKQRLNIGHAIRELALFKREAKKFIL
jgi:secreted Zn-dependent insulinase-like peptidase